MIARPFLVSLAALAAVAPSASAQPGDPAPASSEVRVEVFVHDEGRPLPAPDASDLTLRLGDQPVPFEWTPDEPLSVAVVFDLSSSVTGARLRAASSGVASLFDSLSTEDRCALISFTRSTTLASGWDAGCAAAAEAARGLRSGGPSALNNAVLLAMGLLADAPGRPVLVVFTDGVDGASWPRDTWPLVAAAGHTPLVMGVTAPAARGAGSVGGVYGTVSREDLANQISFEGRHVHDQDRDLRGLRNTDPYWALAELAQRSGGELMRTDGNDEDLERALAGVLDAVRLRASLRFTPPAGTAPGWHPLTVLSASGETRHRPGFAWKE